MSEFTCPKCKAQVKSGPNDIGCPVCGYGRQEARDRSGTRPQVEAPPGYKGTYLTELR